MSTNNNVMSHKLNRGFMSLSIGSFVKKNEDTYKIAYLVDTDKVVAINVENGISRTFLATELDPPDTNINSYNMHRDLREFTDKEWKILNKRLKVIKPLLVKNTTKKDVAKQAKKAGVNISTIYRWRKQYERTNSVISLLPEKGGHQTGASLITTKQEKVIQRVIDEHITNQRLPVSSLINYVKKECKKLKIEAPSKNTIRRRVDSISLYKKNKKEGRKTHVNTHLKQRSGKYEASFPLEIVQIDHTPADIIIVNDERKVIGRPWITLAVDLYSRVVIGFHLSLDAPSTNSVALCLAQAINPKDDWLRERGIDANWPIWGRMHTLHADNGADFRSNSLTKSCQALEINLVWRAIGKTHWGGHIERLLGTIMRELHRIPGTTFSNIKERFEYDSEDNAIMTFSELEEYIGVFITKYYHQQIHSTLGITPLKKLELGMLESDSPGYQSKPNNPQTILLELLPSMERAVRKTGVHIDGLSYYDDVLRPYIDLHKHKNHKQEKQLFKRDPRDITYIWFYEKDTQTYHKIPSAEILPPLNLWELKEIKQHIKDQNQNFDEALIINALEELDDIVNKAKIATKKARRKTQQKKEHSKSLSVKSSTPSSTSNNSEWDDDDWDDNAFD